MKKKQLLINYYEAKKLYRAAAYQALECARAAYHAVEAVDCLSASARALIASKEAKEKANIFLESKWAIDSANNEKIKKKENFEQEPYGYVGPEVGLEKDERS